MTWPTHALAGVASLWLLTIVPPEVLGYDFGTLAACAALGALLPDLDASDSKIKHLRLLGTNIKPFFLAAQVVYGTDQHRGLLHSLAGWAMAAFVSVPLMGWVWTPWLVFLLGYGSPLAADSTTKAGILLFTLVRSATTCSQKIGGLRPAHKPKRYASSCGPFFSTLAAAHHRMSLYA